MSKYHACHVKRRWMSQSATPATQSEDRYRQDHTTCSHTTHTTCHHTTSFSHTTYSHTTSSHTICSHRTCPPTHTQLALTQLTQLVITQLAHTELVHIHTHNLSSHNLTSTLTFAWQAWHLATWTFTLRRRGTWRHGPSLCVAGTYTQLVLTQLDIDAHFAWQT